jgi:O-acetyl-ADP-ribose deacetylase (regulator of RNase III)
MSVKIVNGDILKGSEDIIGHQVNCQGVMGSGLAKQLRDTYSNLYPAYKEVCGNHDPHSLLGKCHIVKTGSRSVANLFGQLNYGRSKLRYTDYEALREALITLRRRAEKNSLSVALPYNLGCGLANGEWTVVEGIIEEVFKDYDVTLYKFG